MLLLEIGGGVTSAARILDERAKGLARPFGSPGPDGAVHLVLSAGGRRVALPMVALRSVVPAPPITRIPSEGRPLVGLAALGGEVVPVADLAALLGFDEPTSDREGLLVVVADGESQLALKVDAVEGHEALLPHLAARIDLSDAAGHSNPLTTPVGADGLVVLDIGAALTDPRLFLPGGASDTTPQGLR